jgi:hypothetical protein
MTKHRMITGFVAVALLAVAAVISFTMRSNSHSTDLASSVISHKELTGDHNRLPTEDFHDNSLVFPREAKR